MISVVCWRWGRLFSPAYVERMRSMLARQLRLPHRVYCVTDDVHAVPDGVVPIPITEYAHTTRCRRRMVQFSRAFGEYVGPRFLALDLDMVITGDITELVDRPEPLVGWRVGYAGVISGSFLLMDTGILHALYAAYAANPDWIPELTGERNASDQAMLNWWLRRNPVAGMAEWTEANGIVTWFGSGYERLEHRGMGPHRPALLPGARLVVLGSADKAVLDEGRYDWVREHWR